MKALTFKLLLLITVLVLSSGSFAQFDWTKDTRNPIFSGSGNGTWDKHVMYPMVVFNAELNRYEMWYCGSEGSGSFYPYRIGFAFSADGINWTKYAGNPVLTPTAGTWDEGSVDLGMVLRENGQYKMWYVGMRNNIRQIGYATSPDGINWTKNASPVLSPGSAAWEVGGVAWCSVLSNSGSYTMFYTGLQATGYILRIGRATSLDGINWQKDATNNPVLSNGAPGQWDDESVGTGLNCLKIDNTLYMWYTGWNSIGLTKSGLATSTNDGITWTKYSGNPVLNLGTSGSWDASMVETGTVLLEGNTFRMWYDAYRDDVATNLWRIGTATSPLQSSIWQMQNSGFPANVMVIDFSAVNNQVCWAVGQVYPQEITPYAGYIRTTDGGNNWVCDTIPGITNGFFQQIFAIDADTAYATAYVLSGGNSKGIYKTTDGGTTWNKQNAYNASLYGPGYIHFFDAQNGIVIGDPNLETYTTTNGGVTWNQVSMPPALTDEITWLNGTSINAVGNTIWFGTGARLFKSTDRGYTWTIIISEPQYIRWSPSIAFQDSQNGIYSLKKQGDASDHLYRKTTDGGSTWNTISNAILDNIAPTALQHIPGTPATYIVSGGRNPGMNGTAITNNAGETWSLIDNVGNLYIIFPSIYVGWGSLRETNVVQTYIGPPLPVPVELTSFTAKSENQKIILNWITATELNNNGFEIQRRVAESGFATIGFVRGEGTTTNQKQYSFIDKDLADGKYFYRLKQVDYNGTYEYSNVIEVDVRSLNDYALEQNFPNPFNPTTTIGYVLREKTDAKLILLNAIGEEVAVLVNEEQEKGFHKVDFNAANLPSGVYFYRLQAGDPSTGSGQSFVQTRKMILLK